MSSTKLKVSQACDYSKSNHAAAASRPACKDQKCRTVPEPRVVPAFSIQANRQKNTAIVKPPATDVFKQTNLPERSKTTSRLCLFRKYYDRGDFPCYIEHTFRSIKLGWKMPLDQVDYEKFLPLFAEGLLESAHPYAFIANQGIHELIENGGRRVLATIPFMVPHFKNVLNCKDPHRICLILKIIEKLVTHVEFAGEALVPYYRQLLPVLGLFHLKNVNLGDRVEYGQGRSHESLGDQIEATLNLLERSGGPNAYINIRYIIPSYDSCMGNS